MSRRGDDIERLFSEFGERLARILDTEDDATPSNTPKAKRKPAIRRAPVMPTREIDDATRAKARAIMRRSGIYVDDK